MRSGAGYILGDILEYDYNILIIPLMIFKTISVDRTDNMASMFMLWRYIVNMPTE